MKIVLRKESNIPYYKQIYMQIVERIQSGMLSHGDSLPSLRSMAEDLQINLLTVRKAYKHLEKKEYIRIEQGKGAYIHKHVKKDSKQIPYKWQQTKTINVMRSQYAMNQHRKYYDFSQAILYPRLLPNPFLADEMHKILNKDKMILATYGPVQGDYELRVEIANYLNEHQKLVTDPSQLLITSGAQQGIDLIAQTLLKPGDIVLVESPCYSAALDIFINKGAQIIPVSLDNHGVRSDLIDDICQSKNPVLLYTNPTFQNPTGTVMSKERRMELIELAELYEFFIIEDDSFGEIYFEDAIVPPPIKNFDTNGHVLYIKGFSKTLAPGLRIASLIADGPIFAWLYAVKGSMDIGSPLLTQKALLPFLRAERMKHHLEKLRTALQIRRDITIDMLSPLKEIQFEIPDGGFNLWITLPNSIDPFTLLQKANEVDVSFLPGTACLLHNDINNNQFRISYSMLNEKDMLIGLEKLHDTIRKFKL
ncbi:PLP-dependent aminotransferase family protein [Bacillus cereus]|uniref:Transcriptional regulator, GntR family/aminotransferase, class I protein n=1 Tax=Bacillus cereus (strain AH820) TaxID=405535 RepID=B7JQX2_BACC0|nr:PLP-dependent aminotransferase family protein [Bacillus cereus]ACK91566.1 transcriptional regulator, GntR family/aminotransferase, class I protein [Bacillus cereus AH820]AJH60889.1 aminotransferase class I and II family protein [Bacillus cereus]AJK35915.1 aminotransferase class I and II family protein [Bacillus cereus]KWU54631.1 GntR family transcriptional regulator [Bacillus cereus]MCQ0954333.1 PLP-dependent aminotransferase family protein [Bacillus cereus]